MIKGNVYKIALKNDNKPILVFSDSIKNVLYLITNKQYNPETKEYDIKPICNEEDIKDITLLYDDVLKDY